MTKSGGRPRGPLVLLTNDDGFFSDGINDLARSIGQIADCFIVAPDREKSATSLALTLHHPLRAQKIRPRVYAVDGTPADCIYVAIQKLLPGRPDLIISGINHGPNLGQQDISYSGTVAGAVQGTFLEIPSLAVSLLPDEKGRFPFESASRLIAALAEKLVPNKIPKGITLNINIPADPPKGIRITSLGWKRYNPEIIEKKDPRKNIYYWIGNGKPLVVGGRGSDIEAVQAGYVSITPLHSDLTDFKALKNSLFQEAVSLPLKKILA